MFDEDARVLIKEISNEKKGYFIRLEQHDCLYVVIRNGRPLPPVSNLSMALSLFDKLVDKEDKVYNN